jgi:hypothetical protein
MGEHGDRIARARRQALEILETRSACAAWFQESDPLRQKCFVPCATNWIGREPLTLTECEANSESILQTSLGREVNRKRGKQLHHFFKCQRTILFSTISDNRVSRRHASCLALVEDRFL